MKRKILVAYDGSELSHEALREAEIQAAGVPDTEVRVISVVTQTGPITNAAMARNIEEEIAGSLRKQMKEIEQTFDAGESTIQTEVVIDSTQKNAGRKIAEYASENAFDMIIIGSRGLGGVRELLLGSVSSQVVQYADCRVLVVK